jgi:hypothetical protein
LRGFLAALALVALTPACSSVRADAPTTLLGPSPIALEDGQLVAEGACHLEVHAIAAPAGAGNRCWFHAEEVCVQAAPQPTWSVSPQGPDVAIFVLTGVEPPQNSEDGRGDWAYIQGTAGTYEVTATGAVGTATIRATIGDETCTTAPKR